MTPTGSVSRFYYIACSDNQNLDSLAFPPYNMERHLNPSLSVKEEFSIKERIARTIYSLFYSKEILPENSNSEELSSGNSTQKLLLEKIRFARKFFQLAKAPFREIFYTLECLSSKSFENSSESLEFFKETILTAYGVAYKMLNDGTFGELPIKERLTLLRKKMGVEPDVKPDVKPPSLGERELLLLNKIPLISTQKSFNPDVIIEELKKVPYPALEKPDIPMPFFQIFSAEHPIIEPLSKALLDIFSMPNIEESKVDTGIKRNLEIFSEKNPDSTSIKEIFLFFIDHQHICNVEIALACHYLKKLIERFFPEYQNTKVPRTYLLKMLFSSLSLSVKGKSSAEFDPQFVIGPFSSYQIELWHKSLIDEKNQPTTILEDHWKIVEEEPLLRWNSPIVRLSSRPPPLHEEIRSFFKKLFSSEEIPAEDHFLHPFISDIKNPPIPEMILLYLSALSVSKQSYYLTLYVLKKVFLKVFSTEEISPGDSLPKKAFFFLMYTIFYITLKKVDPVLIQWEKHHSLPKETLITLSKRIYSILDFSLQIPRKEFFEHLPNPHKYFFKNPPEEKKE